MKSFEDFEEEAEINRRKVEKWGDDDETNKQLIELAHTENEAQKAKDASALALAMLTIKATRVVDKLLEDEDPQVQARAVELVYSRTIPKVAAKHIEEAGSVESADTVAMREEIYELVKKNQKT